MENEVSFLLPAGILCLLFAGCNILFLFTKKRNAIESDSIIVSIHMPNPATEKRNNSKWAILSYQVGGISYLNKTPLQVSRNARLGDHIKVLCNPSDPEQLYSCSPARVFISLSLGVLFLLLAILG